MKVVIRKLLIFVISLVAADSVCYNIFSAFAVPAALVNNIILLLLTSAAFLLLLNLLYWNKKIAIASSVGVFLLAVSFIIFSHATNWFASHAQDWKTALFYFLISVCCMLVFAASHSRIAILLLFFAGIAAWFFLSVLEYKRNPFCLFLFLLSVAILFVLRTAFCKDKKISFQKRTAVYTFGTAAVLCSFSVVISFCIFSFVISPLHPKSTPLRLLSNYTFLIMAQKTGAATPVEKQTASTLVAKQYAPSNVQNKTKISCDTAQKPLSSKNKISDTKKKDRNVKHINYIRKINWPLIIASSVIFLIVLIYAAKICRRHLWHKKIAKLNNNAQMIELYLYFVKTLSHIGHKKLNYDSPLEYADKVDCSINQVHFGEVLFRDITNLFMKVNYGKKDLSSEEYHFIAEFDHAFMKHCRDSIGTLRYCLKFIAI